MKQGSTRALPTLVLLALALLPLAFVGLVEAMARIDLRLHDGYTYGQGLAYLPHPNLVFQLNCEHHSRQGRGPTPAILSVPLSIADGDRRPRLWVLGGSTPGCTEPTSAW